MAESLWELVSPRATESQDDCQGPGERARLGRTATRPRGVTRKNAAGGRWGFKMSGAGAHPTAPEGGRGPRDGFAGWRALGHGASAIQRLLFFVLFLRSADARPVLIGIRDAERWAVWNFGCWKNDAAVVVVRFEFEGG